jgi:HlyD family secretion protein
MLESLYDRSMRDDGDRGALRVLAQVLVAVCLPFVGALFVPVDDVVRVDGVVEPEAVLPVQASEDSWVRFDGDPRGQTLAEGQVLGSMRYELVTERHRYETAHLREQLAAFETATRGLRTALDERGERMTQLTTALAERQERVRERPLVAPHAGVVLTAGVPPGEYTWRKKGDLILELFRDDQLVVRGHVPPHKSAALAVGLPATLENERTGERVAGRVRRVFFADEGSRGIAVMVDVEGDEAARFRCAQPLVARIHVGHQPLWALLRELFVQ